MYIIKKLKPEFLKYSAPDSGPFTSLFNFRQLWKSRLTVLLCVALGPFIALAVFDYMVTKYDTEEEIHLRTARLVSNARRTVSFFLEQRKLTLDFITKVYSFEEISREKKLQDILESLKESIGGFTDLGLIDSSGRQVHYAGPYALENADYSSEDWYQEVVARGMYISHVYRGFREVPHLVIAIKHSHPDNSFYVLRATINTELFNQLLSQIDLMGNGDAFIINKYGLMQTPSRSHGKVLQKISLPIPDYSEHTEVLEEMDRYDKQIIVGYAYIPDSPFILMITEEKSVLMKPWRQTRNIILFFILLGILGILIVVYWVATHLVNQVFLADHKRVQTLHEVEQSSKLASIGRLASGVAHEINNPLAIINEKAGLLKDIFSFREEYKNDTKSIQILDSILSSVERCGTITKRLLGFARHLDSNVQTITLPDVVEDVLGFLVKEAEYRSITVNVDIDPEIPPFETDRGKLQQILLNLVNNAFAAMNDENQLDIIARRTSSDDITIEVRDNGCGIPEEDLKRVFEPFFSTKTKTGGTGLGLSITYGLIQELGGKMNVTSKLGKGTTFTITLPLHKKNDPRK